MAKKKTYRVYVGGTKPWGLDKRHAVEAVVEEELNIQMAGGGSGVCGWDLDYEGLTFRNFGRIEMVVKKHFSKELASGEMCVSSEEEED